MVFQKILRKYGKVKVLLATILVLVGANTYFTLAATLKLPPSNLGLVGYWTMNEDYNRDYSGLVNNFTVNGTCLSTSSDSVSGGISITNWATCGGGVQKLGYLSTGDIFNSTSEFTFVAWVKGTGILWSGAPTFWFQANAGGAFLDKYTGSWVNIATGSGGGSSSGWRQLVLTKNSSGGVKIYSNTVEIASSTSQTFYTPTSQTVGRYAVYDDSGYHFTGKIDEIRLYKRILSTDEIKNLYTIKTTKANTSQNTKVSNGLIGLWSFDAVDMNGTTAYDRSGSGNNGTLTNGPTLTTGKVGQGLKLDGVDDYNVLGSGLTYPANWSDPFTIGLWINVPASANWVYSPDPSYPNGTEGNILGKGNYTGSVGITRQAGTGVNGNSLGLWLRGSSAVCTAYGNITRGKWYHAVGVWDGNAVKLYINGVLTTTTSCTYTSLGGSPTSSQWDFGGAHAFGGNVGNYLKGSLDDARIYNRALSAAEVKQLYNTGLGTQVNSAQVNTPSSSLSTGLVGYWPFNGPDISGTTAYDRSTGGNNGTLVNGPTAVIGKIGQALKFSAASTQKVDLATKFPAITSAITISTWVNPDATQVIYADIWGNHQDDFKGIDLQQNNATTNQYSWGYGNGTGWSGLSGYFNISANTWTHIVAVKDATTCYVYLNGVEQSGIRGACPSAIVPATTMNFSVGRGYAGGGSRYFNGKIDEVRVYNRALSVSEINQLYLLGK